MTIENISYNLYNTAGASSAGAAAGGGAVQKLHVNQQNLQRAWDVTQRSTREDWSEWIRRFSVELLRESPSPALRSCSALAQVNFSTVCHWQGNCSCNGSVTAAHCSVL
jgi:hypothetical protein